MTAPEYAVGPDGPLYLDTHELAARYHMSADAIRQWRHRGYGPLGVRFGKHVLYPLPEIEAWEQRQIEQARREQRSSQGIAPVTNVRSRNVAPVRGGTGATTHP